jgi:hypothetical protein
MAWYLGIDVGFRNLALCIINPQQWIEYLNDTSNDPGIKLWKNLNLFDDPPTCCGTVKSGKQKGQPCSSLAKFKAAKDYYCSRHKPSSAKNFKPPNSKTVNVQKLKIKAFKELDQHRELLSKVGYVAIESQMRKNQKMKMFASGIEAYFLIRRGIDWLDQNRGNCVIRNSPAKNKLNHYSGPAIPAGHLRDPYRRRKYLAEKQTEYFLRNCPQVLDEYYLGASKKDDLADAFLHCTLAITL